MKITFDNFLGGLSVASDNIGAEGMYAEARDVDPQRSPGYIRPGFEEGATSQTGLDGLITDAKIDPDATGQGVVYAIDSTAIYKITGTTPNTFTQDANWPHTIPINNGQSVIFYDIGSTVSSTTYLFYLNSTTMGRCDLSGPTFIEDYLTGSLSASPLKAAAHYSPMEWGAYMWVPNGRFLSKFDGTTGDTGTWTEDALTLAEGWEITSLFSTENYIGICAWVKPAANYNTRWKGKSAVFFWDGNSDFYNYMIPVEDNKIVSSFNDGDDIYILTEGRGYGTVLRKLVGRKAVAVKNFKIDIAGTHRDYYTDYPNVIDIFQNRLLIGLTCPAFRNDIFAYGSINPLYPIGLFQVSSGTDTPVGETVTNRNGIGFLGHLYRQQYFASFYDGTNYYWKSFVGGNATNADVNPNYQEMGRKVKINYVKFYFKPLVADDDVTVSIDTDFGTSNSLGTITHSNDGAVTTKRFDKRIECYSFRPVINWSVGGAAFSRIVVDYTPLKSNR